MNDVQTFRGPTQRAAFDAVKAAFGPDAIIVETREVRGGRYAMGGGIEVVAKRSTPATALTALTSRPEPGVPGRRSAHATRGASMGAAAGASTTASNGAARSAMRHPPFLAPPAAVELGSDALRALLEEQGTSPLVARRLVERAARLPRKSGDMCVDLGVAVNELVEGTPPPWRVERGQRRVVALVGPTGVGKTTTIAKIAARAILDEGLRVALISLDTYRVGAIEQLARYGEILGVPMVVAKSGPALAAAVDEMRDADLVLIDSAGRSPNDAAALEEQALAVAAVPDIEALVTLTATSDERALARHRTRWERFTPHGIVVTKADEAECGAVLTTAALLGLRVACITDGQRVPEDIHRYDGAAIAATLLGEKARA